MKDDDEIDWRRNVFVSFGASVGTGTYDRNTRVRLLASCDMPADRACWVSRHESFTMAGRRVPVQRAAYALFNSPIGRGASVVSTCGNPKCCLRSHLMTNVKSGEYPSISRAAANDDCQSS